MGWYSILTIDDCSEQDLGETALYVAEEFDGELAASREMVFRAFLERIKRNQAFVMLIMRLMGAILLLLWVLCVVRYFLRCLMEAL